MATNEHICKIPCNSMPLTIIAERERALRTIIHVDRVADFNVLIYILKGSMEIIEDGATYTLTPRTLMFLKSGVRHWGVKPFEIGTTWLYAHFYADEATENMRAIEGGLLFNKKRDYLRDDHNCYITLPKSIVLPIGNHIQEYMEDLILLYQSARQSDMPRMNLKLWEILLYCSSFSQSQFEKASENNRIHSIIDFLSDNYCGRITSRDVEQLVGLSYKYIATLFKQKTGMTIKEYQLMLRVRRAVKLLGTTEMSMSEIASEIGFCDAFYFSKIFKREMGLSPLRFREGYTPGI